MLRLPLAVLLLAALQGCATLTEPTTQTVYVQAVEGHRPLANVGCLLANDTGRWYVNAPGRVKVTRSARPLSVDCRRDGAAAGYEAIASRPGASALWGNLVVTAGLGYIVDRNTGAGFSYPDTLTIVMKRPTLAQAQPEALAENAATPIH